MYRRKYVFYYCRDCEMDFLMPDIMQDRKRTFCPSCGENMYTQVIKKMWIERPFNYKRPYSVEEKEEIIAAYKEGFSYKEIAESLFARTPQAVKRKIQEMRKEGVLM